MKNLSAKEKAYLKKQFESNEDFMMGYNYALYRLAGKLDGYKNNYLQVNHNILIHEINNLLID